MISFAIIDGFPQIPFFGPVVSVITRFSSSRGCIIYPFIHSPLVHNFLPLITLMFWPPTVVRCMMNNISCFYHLSHFLSHFVWIFPFYYTYFQAVVTHPNDLRNHVRLSPAFVYCFAYRPHLWCHYFVCPEVYSIFSTQTATTVSFTRWFKLSSSSALCLCLVIFLILQFPWTSCTSSTTQTRVRESRGYQTVSYGIAMSKRPPIVEPTSRPSQHLNLRLRCLFSPTIFNLHRRES